MTYLDLIQILQDPTKIDMNTPYRDMIPGQIATSIDDVIDYALSHTLVDTNVSRYLKKIPLQTWSDDLTALFLNVTNGQERLKYQISLWKERQCYLIRNTLITSIPDTLIAPYAILIALYGLDGKPAMTCEELAKKYEMPKVEIQARALVIILTLHIFTYDMLNNYVSTDIFRSGLSPTIKQCLFNGTITTISQLLDMTYKQASKIPGIGLKRLGEIDDHLVSYIGRPLKRG